MSNLPDPAPSSVQPPPLPTALQLSVPVVNAPMAGAAGGALAAAVSTAGGLGMIGIASRVEAEWVATQAGLARASGRPWGAGLMAWVLEDSLDPLRYVLAEGPDLVCVSFGDPGAAAALIHEAGSLCAMQVGNAADLERALEADIDVVVCRGGEGGGHGRNDVATLPLLQQALSSTGKPVIAAGGIADSRGVAAVLAAGAQAAWVGTRFAASTESLSHGHVKEAIAGAGLNDTVYTRAFDIAQRIPWPAEFGGRALRNSFSDHWSGREQALSAAVASDSHITEAVNTARRDADISTAPVYAGQSAALSRGGETAAAIMEDLAGFRSHLQAAARRWH